MDAIDRVTGTAVDKTDDTCIHWQHCRGAQPEFDERVFDDQWLASQGYIVNRPSAGRGASLFLNIDQHELVLRHYRRGGMVRSISEKSYVWQGLHGTRAWVEFDVLCLLAEKGLPSPRPYACQVKRKGRLYSATLITHYLDGLTLAERMCSAKLSHEQWFAVGQCISEFHLAGINHADLNAHNILFDDDGRVSVIDFDRATLKQAARTSTTWCKQNLKRLQRSLHKIDSSGPAHYDGDCWLALVSGYDHGFAAEQSL